jgi:4-hydroxy-tetrahydrodipicolinate synthase
LHEYIIKNKEAKLVEIKGVHYILLTPFTEEENIDEESLRNIIDFQLAAGVHGLAILGFMGEVHKMIESEKERVIKIVADQVKGRVPFSVGIRTLATYTAIYQARQAEELGAASVFVAPLNIQDDEVLFEFYSKIAKSVNIPVVIHDYPIAFNTVLSPSLIARLNKEGGINFLKLEDYPSGKKLSKIREMTQGRLKILGGLGGQYYLEELQRGAEGIMTGFRYDAQFKLGMAIRKYIYYKRGIIASNAVRHPAPVLDDYTKKELESIVERVGLSISDSKVQDVI